MLNKLFGLRCPDCGKPINEDNSFCPHCGASLDIPLGTPATNHPDANQRYFADARNYLEIAQQAYDTNSTLKNALFNCDLAIQYAPEFAEAHNLKGLILDAMGRTNEAITSYQEAIRLNPLLQDARSNLEDAEADLKQQQEKTERWNKTLPKVIFGVVAIFALVCAVTLGCFLYKLGRPYFEPKINIVLEPDYSLLSAVDPSELEITTEMLNERCRILGYKVSFVATENNQVIASVPESIQIETFLKSVTAIGLLEFVDFGKTPIPTGNVVATDFDYPYFPQTGENQWHTVMTSKEIITVDVTENSFGQYEISFFLTPEGTNIFTDFTTNNVGSYLGIVLDKNVISSPMVNSPITGGSGVITGQFTKEEAEALAMYLKMGEPLPIPLTVQTVSVVDK